MEKEERSLQHARSFLTLTLKTSWLHTCLVRFEQALTYNIGKRRKTRLAVLKFLTAQEVSPLHFVPVGSIPSLPELSLVRNFAPPLWQGLCPRTPFKKQYHSEAVRSTTEESHRILAFIP